MKTYRSPDGPPLCPASPSPATRSREPSSTPAGTFTEIARSSRTRPAPLHVAHGSLITFPAPPHCGHVRATAKNPCEYRTCPRPPHPVHVAGVVPGFAPLPLQVAHGITRGTLMEISFPKTDSSNVRLRS